MAFPRAKLKRFNETKNTTPGVGAYDVTKETKHGTFKDPVRSELDRTRALSRLEQSSKQLQHKASIASVRGEMGKHVEDLHQRWKAAEERCIDLEILRLGADKSRDMFQKDLSVSKTKVEELEAERKDLEARIDEVKNHVQSLDDERSKLVQKLEIEDKLQKDFREKCLKESQDKLVKYQEMKEAEQQELFANLERVKVEKASVEANVDAMAKEVDSLRSKTEDLEICNRDLTQKNCDFEEKLHAFDKKKDELLQKISVISEEKMNLVKEIETLKSSERDNCDKYSELQKEIEALNKALLLKDYAIIIHEKDLNKAKQHVSQIQAEYDEQRQQLLKEIEEKSHKEDQALKTIESLNLQLQSNAEECRILAEKNTSAVSEVQNAQEQAESLKQCFETLLQEKTAVLDQVRDDRDKLRMEVHTLEEIKACLEGEKSQVKENYESNLQKLKDEQEETKKKYELDLKSVTDELAVQIENLKEEKRVLVEMEEKTRCSHEKEMETLAKQHDTGVEEFDSRIKMLEENYDKQLQELRTTIDVCERKEEELLNAHRKEVESLLQEKLLLSEKHEKELQTTNKDYLDLIITKEKQIVETSENAANEITQIRLEKEEIEKKLDEIKEKERNILIENESEIKRLKEDNAQEIKILKDEIRDCVRKEEEALSSHKREVERLNTEQAQVLKDYEAGVTRLKENHAKQLEEMKTNLNKREEDLLNSHRKEVERLTENHQVQVEKYENEIQKVNKEHSDLLRLKERENVESIEKASLEMDQLRSEKNDIVKKLEELKIKEENNDLVYKNESKKLSLEKEELQQKLLDSKKKEMSMLQDHKADIKRFEEEKSQLLRYHKSDLESLNEDHECLLNQVKEDLTQAFEEEKSNLIDEFDGLAEEKAELENVNIALLEKKQELEKELSDVKDDADRERDGLNHMISEFSEQIQEMEERWEQKMAEEEEASQHDDMESWRSKYEALEKRMEPFKDLLDNYEMERKLVLEKDKFTADQIERLTQECIRNMGHQNHKQKVKYVNQLKQENLDLQKKYQEMQEEVRRQNVAVKKYKERIDKLETHGKPMDAKKVKQPLKLPLREGNR